MKCLDTSFLIDYLDGESATQEYLNDRPNTPFFSPSLSLFETHRGAARVDGTDGVERTTNALDWVEPLPLDAAAAREAALVEAELLEDGQPINLGDVLIAGIVRSAGGTIVTDDGDFERVRDLSVDRFK